MTIRTYWQHVITGEGKVVFVPIGLHVKGEGDETGLTFDIQLLK